VNANGKLIGKGGLKAQTEQIFKNLEIALRAVGAELHDVIKCNIYSVQGQDVRPAVEVFQRVWEAGKRHHRSSLGSLWWSWRILTISWRLRPSRSGLSR
jgi:enamine deaminase RidA (YjgF/YER057c/UK114 family)